MFSLCFSFSCLGSYKICFFILTSQATPKYGVLKVNLQLIVIFVTNFTNFQSPQHLFLKRQDDFNVLLIIDFSQDLLEILILLLIFRPATWVLSKPTRITPHEGVQDYSFFCKILKMGHNFTQYF